MARRCSDSGTSEPRKDLRISGSVKNLLLKQKPHVGGICDQRLIEDSKGPGVLSKVALDVHSITLLIEVKGQ